MHSKTFLLALFILLKFAIQYFAIAPEYDLQRDEFLHLDQAKHLAWGYLSVPPFTSWISYLILLLGNGVFWIKFFPALFGALTIVVVWKTIESLGGGLFALCLGATGLLCSVLVRINILYQPNSFDYLSWTLVYSAFVRYFQTEKPKFLYLGALAFALGFLNKYNISFFALGLFPSLLLEPTRKIFLNKHLYFALALALLVVAPNLYWQYRNDFPVLTHMRELSERQLVNVERADFLKEQLMFFMGSIWIWITALLAFWFYKPFKPYRFLFFGFAFSLGFFLYFRAKGYYAIGLYPILHAFGAVYFEEIWNKGWTFYLRPLALVFIAVFFAMIAPILLPLRSPSEIVRHPEMYQNMGMLRWEDGQDHPLPQDFSDMQGWSELGQKVNKLYAKMNHKNATLILCDNYGQAGAINFYSRLKTQAVSLNADYINWIDLEHPIQNVILIQNADDDDPKRTEEQPLFERITLVDSIENQYAREKGARIYALEGAKVPIAPILREDIAKRKRGEED
jgi:hypothetical protein